MKALIELNGRTHVMTMQQAEEVVSLIHSYGSEVYETKTNWNTKEKVVQHYIYEITPAEVGTGELKFMTDALYGMGKLRGRPE